MIEIHTQNNFFFYNFLFKIVEQIFFIFSILIPETLIKFIKFFIASRIRLIFFDSEEEIFKQTFFLNFLQNS